MLITKKLLLIGWSLLLLLTTACTNTLYQAELNVLNSEGQSRQAIVYWTKTEKLLGEAKAGPIVLLTACSNRRINFDQTSSGIQFRGEPGMDRLQGHSSTVSEGTLCGQVENGSILTELKSGPLLLSIKCEGISDDFTLGSSSYIQARELPYQFDIQESSQWSFLGTIIEAPQPPECR